MSTQPALTKLGRPCPQEKCIAPRICKRNGRCVSEDYEPPRKVNEKAIAKATEGATRAGEQP